MLALGILCFIQRNFKKAGTYFEMAIRENPTDHSMWNKLGAALANSIDFKKAIQAY